MSHETSLITTIAAGLVFAFLFGLLAARLRLPIIVGYIVAGIAIGPFTPGFVADKNIANQLSEIGVSLLMFGVGLHFSIADLLKVRRIAVVGALTRIVLTTALASAVALTWGWSWKAGLILGLGLSVASTVVMIRTFEQRRQLDTVDGQIAVGWLIVEDIVTVFALVVLPALAGAQSGLGADVVGAIGLLILKVTAFVAAMVFIGKKAIPALLGRVARTGSRELFTIGVLAIALGIAFGASMLFGLSPALGAFFAGIIISESDLSHHASSETLPLKEVFTVLFFVSVGMLFDPAIVVTNPWHIIAALAIAMVAKSIVTLAIVLMFRYPIGTALTVSASLAQVGEFSFVLVGLATSLKLVGPEAMSIVVAVSALSICLNPLVFSSTGPIDRWIRKYPRLVSLLERDAPDCLLDEDVAKGLTNHVVMVGFGRVGATISKALDAANINYTVVEKDHTLISELKQRGVKAIFGDASRPGVLSHTGIKTARLLVIAAPDCLQAATLIQTARELNPSIAICARTHSFAQAEELNALGVDKVTIGEVELALEMSRFAISRYRASNHDL